LTTTGYGDYSPLTDWGRIVGIFVMLLGTVIVALFTAIFSSVYVENRIRKGQGLEAIKTKNHILVCGWNYNVENFIRTLEIELDYPNIVLVNTCDPVQMNNIISHHKDSEIEFVSGDFSNELILKKAGIERAESVIIVADLNEITSNKADEKTIITALTVKNINPRIRLYAHIVNPDNAPHLQRAKADDVVISDKFSGFLLAMHVTNPGVPRVFDELLSFEFGNEIVRMAIPSEWYGKSFIDVVKLFKEEKNAIIFGIAKESRSVAINDLLSDDNSYLDQFIRQKLQESGKKFSERERLSININPEKDYIIEPNDIGMVIYDKF
jgi:voltage-gated potassium channel